TRAAFDLGMTPPQFLLDHNPMYRRGEELLSPYISELPQPEPGRSRILLINNSSLPFTAGQTNSLGGMHKAEIINPTESERRIVNSTMIVVGDEEAISQERQQEFVITNEISRKTY